MQAHARRPGVGIGRDRAYALSWSQEAHTLLATACDTICVDMQLLAVGGLRFADRGIGAPLPATACPDALT